MSEIRYNRLEDSYVIIAPERLHRPDYMAWRKEIEHITVCPFCEGNENMTPPEIYAIRGNETFADESGWQTRVIPNLYKALQIEASNIIKHDASNSVWDGFGAHEIIIDTPNHINTMSEWSNESFFKWLKTIQSRVHDLRKDSRIAYISVFKNHGAFGGASQSHPHTQLIALPVVPKSIERKYNRINEYYINGGKTLMSVMIEEEKKEKKRIVIETESFLAFCPFASEYPFEVMITSDILYPEIDRIEDDKLEELSTLLEELFKKMELQLGNFDFNLSLSIPPLQEHFDIDTVCRFSIRIMPRIYRHGGFELSTGTMINPVKPERSAALLREPREEK